MEISKKISVFLLTPGPVVLRYAHDKQIPIDRVKGELLMKLKERIGLTAEQIEEMAKEVRQFLLDHDMWIDADIYFNGKKFTCYDPVEKKYYYNDPEHLVEVEDVDPSTYFEYVNKDHILSMSFEGPLYEMINGYGYPDRWLEEFNKIFEKRGVYYELGHAWNFSCYYI